jgi:hypothetical protein
MRTFRLARRSALATAALLAAGTTLAVIPSAAADQPLRLATVAVPDHSTSLDLGTPGLSAGDTELFLDDVQRHGRTVGTQAGSCTIITVTHNRLVAACTATLTLPEGQLTLQGINDENPNVGPTGFAWAVNGGTGEYATARGEAAGTFRPGTNIVDLVIRLR